MLTRKPTSPVRNKLAPLGWAHAIGLNVDEGSGTTLANVSTIRTGTASHFDFTVNAAGASWGVDANEGPYVDLPDGAAGWANSSGTDKTYPRGTIVLRVQLNDPTAAASPIFSLGRNPIASYPGRMRLRYQTGTTNAFDVTHTFDQAGGFPVATPLSVPMALSAGQTVTIICTWGERGVGLWVDGVASAGNSSTPIVYPALLENGYAEQIGKHLTQLGNLRLYSYDRLDWQLTDLDVAMLTADPHLLRRPYPTADYLFQPQNPWACRPRPTAVDFEFSGGATIPDTDFYVRVAYGTDPILASPTYTAARQISADDENGVFSISVTGLTTNARHYWIAEWSADGTTWYPFPGGRGTFFPQRTDEQPWRYATFGDLHTKTEHFGFDIVRESGSYLQHRAWAFAEDVRQHCEEYDFVLDVGDNWYDHESDACFCTQNLLKISGCNFAVPGNHENLAGWYQAVTDAELATKPRRSQAWQRWRRNAPNPHKNTYAQGVPWSAVPNIPEIGMPYASNVPWMPDIPADGGKWAAEGIDSPAAYFEAFVYLLPSGSHSARIGGQEDPHTNFAFEWGGGPYKTLIVGVDIYSCSVPGDLLHSDLRTNANECSLSEETWTWLDDILKSNVPHTHVFMHSFPDAGLETGTVWGGSGYYWRGSGVTITGTESLRLQALLGSRRAVLVSAHDHTHAVVRSGNLLSVKLPPAGSGLQFGMNGGIQPTEQYGVPDVWGGDIAGLIYKRGCWGYVLIEPLTGARIGLTLRQTACDTQMFSDQSVAAPGSSQFPDQFRNTWKMRFLGEELTVAGGIVNLGERPTDILCMCDSADGTFVAGGDDPAIITYDTYATANGYVHGATAGDGMPLVSHAPEPIGSPVLDVSGVYADGTKIRVHHMPRTLYETEIRVGQKAEDWSSFGAVPNAYGRNTLVI